jgi:hypothetical protein
VAPDKAIVLDAGLMERQRQEILRRFDSYTQGRSR